MKEIPLTQGKVAIVDDEDFDWLNRWKWCAHHNNYHWYAVRKDCTSKKGRTVRMHRAILEHHGYNLHGLGVDHINHDGLDNRLSNLRPANQSQNNQNRYRAKGTSRYKGVYWHSRYHKWVAYIRINSHGVHLGYFSTEEVAAKAYNRAAIKLFGEFACLNKIGGREQLGMHPYLFSP